MRIGPKHGNKISEVFEEVYEKQSTEQLIKDILERLGIQLTEDELYLVVGTIKIVEMVKTDEQK